MKPLAQVRYPVMLRLRKETFENMDNLAHAQGLKIGPFGVHVMETIAKCPPEKFHAALAAYLDEARRR
jgi:hypothetical protein